MFPKTKKKQILLINFEMTYTGSPRALHNLARVFLDLGYLVDVCTLNPGDYEREFSNLEIKVKTINLKYIKQNIEDFVKYDFIICNTIFCLDIAYYLQNKVTTALFIMEAANLKQLMLDCGLNEDKLCSIKRVFCVSEYAKQEIKKAYNISDIYILHNYVFDLKKKFRNKNQNEKIKFIVSGTIEKRKGQDIAIKAYSFLSEEQRTKSELYIVGDSPQWSKDYREEIDKLTIDGVHIMGVISDSNDLYEFYNNMDVFLVPSRDESCSLVALEASMLKKPIVVTDNVGAKYLLCHQKKNIIRIDNVIELSNIMKKYVDNPRNIKVDGIKNYLSYRKKGTYKVLKKEIKRIVRKL